MKMLPQGGHKMLVELFEDVFGCLKITEKTESKFKGYTFNVKLEKLKLVRLSLFFGYGVPF